MLSMVNLYSRHVGVESWFTFKTVWYKTGNFINFSGGIMSSQVDFLGNSAKVVKDENDMMGFHVEINGKSYSGAQATLEATGVIGCVWAACTDPVTVLVSGAAGGTFAHFTKNSAPATVDGTLWSGYRKRVIKNEGGHNDEMAALSFTGILTGLFRTSIGAIVTGVNAGQLAYRDISGYLYGNNKPHSE